MNRTINKIVLNKMGFTLVELMISTFLLVFIFSGTILTFFYCMDLNEMAKNSSTALLAIKSKITEIENTPYSQISAIYNNTTFTSPDLKGIGVSTINSSNPNLLEVTVTFTWQQKNGRILGEDLNMNGIINPGEDVNNNNILDSPVTVATAIYNI